MGQQQLLLLVLGIVIVGIAVAVGITTFTENRRQAAGDDLILTSTRIAADGITWTIHAAALGGGGGDPSGMTFEALGYTVDGSGNYVSGDGVYTSTATATSIVITASDATNQSYAVTAVYGTSPNCIVTETALTAVPTTPSAPSGCSW